MRGPCRGGSFIWSFRLHGERGQSVEAMPRIDPERDFVDYGGLKDQGA